MMRPTRTDGKLAYFVSCVGRKNSATAAAMDLYSSAWFKKARDFAESKECPWYILSAEYGLVSPSQIIEPYEKTLNTMPVAERRLWAEKVNSQIERNVPQLERAVLLAGLRYREFLTGHLSRRNIVVEVPMKGLRIGEQLAWLSKSDG
jgi:hypothetical protein